MVRALPDYENPPVVEVVLGVQFEPLREFVGPYVGLFWQELREKLPELQEQPYLTPVVERFGVSEERSLRVEFQTFPNSYRYWLLSDTGNQLIQVQQDRFHHNWRKVKEHDVYPRYETIREKFKSEVTGLQEFLKSEGLGSIKPNQCEITYVNHVAPSENWGGHRELDKLVTVFRSDYSDDFLGLPEKVRLALSYLMTGKAGEPLGRLHIRAEPALQRGGERQQIYRLTLTARGEPQGDGLEGVSSFLDLGRSWIVRGFTSVTTPEMHQEWRRLDV